MHVTVGHRPIQGFAAEFRAQQSRFPVAPPRWQPVHTVYVPADRFTAETTREWGQLAAGLVKDHLPGAGELAEVFEVAPELAGDVHARVLAKLAAEPVEDVRVDFEDGYGVRPEEEDGHVEQAVAAVAAMHAAGRLPRRWGLRVKSFADGDPERSLRTLDGFVSGVVRAAGGLPDGFVVTFPKVLMPGYIEQFTDFLGVLESALSLRALPFELQVEAPQTLPFLAPGLGGRRLRGAHFGVFDYTAAIGLPPHEQRLDHPACDHARHAMQTAFAGTGVELSDGSLAASPASDTTRDVHALWRRHASLVRHSLSNGYRQGWDMHPSHLVSRFVTVYAFHLATYDAYQARVRAWEDQRQLGGVLDEPATVKTLSRALEHADLALPR
ncbi:aldolase [Nonomuraea sp. NBC_01738]|uniref:DUF6986 family protein n=1 Tax=Nonomuraea sp. NBC_01738 TaxID=2976003 RepID=UPI002E12FDC2|nr:aldolase [Nonomuraea sp. NBC_01738]